MQSVIDIKGSEKIKSSPGYRQWAEIFNLKTYSKSFKNKRRLENPEENQVVFEGVHEAIIDRETWEMVQRIREGTKRRQPKNTEKHMFAGILYCADCGRKLHFNVNHPHTELKYFNCSNYRGNRGTCNETHYIRADSLEQVMLLEIRRMTAYLRDKEDGFIKLLMAQSLREAERESKRREKTLATMTARCRELDVVFSKTYADNATGKISDEKFMMLSKVFDKEQLALKKKIAVLQAEIEAEERHKESAKSFLRTVRRYTNATELTQPMLYELINHIDVYHASRVNGEITQEVKIYYNSIGAFEVPERDRIPELEVLVEARKGVAYSYTSEKRAG